MCTVTFIARREGYALGMNRDEKLTRVRGMPPTRRLVAGRQIVSPSEPGGGTWIALNDAGVTVALINWYSIPAPVIRNPTSRGVVVTAASAADSPGEVARILPTLPLSRIKPFRLIAVFPSAKAVVEWRWDLKKLSEHGFAWTTRQWISSGCDEPAAQRIRAETFHHALKQKSVGTKSWLRRLHRSHRPELGPFATCMHRSDAATVSYTEVSVSVRSAALRYFDGPPCRSAQRAKIWRIRSNRHLVPASASA